MAYYVYTKPTKFMVEENRRPAIVSSGNPNGELDKEVLNNLELQIMKALDAYLEDMDATQRRYGSGKYMKTLKCQKVRINKLNSTQHPT